MSKELALSVVIGSTVAGAIRGFKSVIGSVDAIGSAIDKANKKKLDIVANNKSLNKIKSVLDSVESRLKRLREQKQDIQIKLATTQSKEKAEQLKQKLEQVRGSILRLNKTKVALKDKFKSTKEQILQTDSAIVSLDKHIKKLSTYKTRLANLQAHRDNFKAKIIDTMAIGATVAAPIKVAMDFESAMADVKKVVNFKGPGEVKAFSQEILKLSTQIPIAADGLAAIAASGGQLGITKDKLIGFTQVTAKMSTAFDMSANDAGEAVAKLMNVYNLTLNKTRKLGDAINYLSDNTAAKSRDIVNVLARVGGTAKMFGLSATQVAALSDAFLAMGKPPEIAATATNALLTKLMTANKQGKKFQKGLKELGISSKTLMREIRKDPNKALLHFLDKVKQIPDKQRKMGILSDLFGAEYSDDIALLVAGLDNYKKALKLVSKEQNYLNSMEKEFQARSATVENKMQLLKNSVAKVGITLGTLFLPVIGKITTALSKFSNMLSNLISEHPKLAKAIGTVVGGLGVFAVTSAVVGYGLTFIIGGFTRLGIAATTTITKLGSVKRFLLGGLGFKSATSAGKTLGSSICGIGECANSTKGKIGGLKKEVLSARSIFARGLTISVGIVGVAAVIAGLNEIAKAQHRAIMDNRIILGSNKDGSYSKKDLIKLKEKEKRLKERIAAAKNGSLLESFLHGPSDKYKIAQLEKLLKRTQKNIQKAQTGWKPSSATPKKVSKKVIEKSKNFAAKVKLIWDLNIPLNKKQELLKKLTKDINLKIPNNNSKVNISQILKQADFKNAENIAKTALQEAKNTKEQINLLHATIKEIANKPPVNNYNVNVHVTGQNPSDVEHAVKKALQEAHYLQSQRSLNDH